MPLTSDPQVMSRFETSFFVAIAACQHLSRMGTRYLVISQCRSAGLRLLEANTGRSCGCGCALPSAGANYNVGEIDDGIDYR